MIFKIINNFLGVNFFWLTRYMAHTSVQLNKFVDMTAC